MALENFRRLLQQGNDDDDMLLQQNKSPYQKLITSPQKPAPMDFETAKKLGNEGKIGRMDIVSPPAPGALPSMPLKWGTMGDAAPPAQYHTFKPKGTTVKPSNKQPISAPAVAPSMPQSTQKLRGRTGDRRAPVVSPSPEGAISPGRGASSKGTEIDRLNAQLPFMPRTVTGDSTPSPVLEEGRKRLLGAPNWDQLGNAYKSRLAMEGGLVPTPASEPGDSGQARKLLQDMTQKQEQEYAGTIASTPIYDPQAADERAHGVGTPRKPGFWNGVKDFLRGSAVNMAREAALRRASGQDIDLASLAGAGIGGGLRRRFDREGSQRQEWEMRHKPEFDRKEALREKIRARGLEEEDQAYTRETRDWDRQDQSMQARANDLLHKMNLFKLRRLPFEALMDDFSAFGKIVNDANATDIRLRDSATREDLANAKITLSKVMEELNRTKEANIGQPKPTSTTDILKQIQGQEISDLQADASDSDATPDERKSAINQLNSKLDNIVRIQNQQAGKTIVKKVVGANGVPYIEVLGQ